MHVSPSASSVRPLPSGPLAAGHIHRFSTRSMGSRLLLQVAGASERDAASAWTAVSAEMAWADAALSRFRADSELSRLNAEAGSVTPRRMEPRLRRMLALAHRAQRQTAGRFDPRTLEVLEALGERAGVPYAPTGASPVIGDGRWLVRVGRERVAVQTPVDSGGLGKGLGLRWALRVGREAAPRASGLLVDAGGDVAASGGPSRVDAWQIGIEDPSGSKEPLAVVALREGALATSSTAVRSWSAPDGSHVHHLIDPTTWQPADGGLLAVTVAHTDPAWAEIWSKALFVAGVRRIGQEARSRAIAAWWVEADGSLHLSPAAVSMTAWRR